MYSIDDKLTKFIEESINKGQYIQKNIEISDGTSNDYFTFNPRDNGQSYSIFAKANIEMPKNIIIPSNYANKPVVSIGINAFSNSENRVIKNQSIETVTIPESITNISDEAFKDCINLKKVIIYGDRVPIIGKNVFSNTPIDLAIYVPSNMVDKYKNDSNWSVYRDKISYSPDIPSPETAPNQDGIVNTVVTTITDSKEVSISYNFYFLNINNSSIDKLTDMNKLTDMSVNE